MRSAPRFTLAPPAATSQEATTWPRADLVRDFGLLTMNQVVMAPGRYEFGGDVMRQAEFDAAVNRLVGESDFVKVPRKPRSWRR